MAPPNTRHGPPLDPPDTGNRISKKKTTSNKTINLSKPSRSTISIETLRKTGVIDKALGATHISDSDTPPTSDIQMDDPFTNSTETPSTSSANKNVRLVSIDLDYPDHEGNLSDCELPYDDPPHQPGKIEEAPLSTSEAASQRILAAQTLFGSIANVLDLQCKSNNKHMHANDIRALNDLCEEFRAVAKRHFEAYVKGTSPCAKNKEDTMPTQNNSHRKDNTPSSYAQAASQNTHLPHRASTTIFDRNRVESRNVLSDDRLFLRLPEDDQLRNLSGYALQSLLKSKLGPDGHLLANALPTKTGFALCPTKGNSEILAVKLSGINTQNGKPTQRASPWKSYHITKVPRRYGTANDNLNISLEPVKNSAMSDAIAAATHHEPGEQKEEKNEYRRVIHRAKESFFKDKIDKAVTSKNIFGIVKWHKSRGTYRSSPLIDPRSSENPPATSPTGKSKALIRNLLTNHSEIGDIPIDAPAVPCRSLPFPSIKIEDIRYSILNAGNTAPGPDEISTTAAIDISPKPIRVDLSSPRSYRSIALLAVLGKGLERLLAKRIAWLAIRNKVIARQQLGALPNRSAVDVNGAIRKAMANTSVLLTVLQSLNIDLQADILLQYKRSVYATLMRSIHTKYSLRIK
ncbi:hypothetical protein EPUL_003611 [Erysiphe pulchra]|uniref:Uncharacterized protein n=1 Tax=Erysiphe pulchra TaxID=225359 RepID=A0A2S4PW40_9PEZI|nr:hypothetical protein EPUL_003611 [Erysiphe pulchra]